jgi:hypothetical protein
MHVARGKMHMAGPDDSNGTTPHSGTNYIQMTTYVCNGMLIGPLLANK